MADSIVPLISSDVQGPLGVCHLPRLWLKVLMGARDLLPEGHDICGMGFDQMVLDGLKLDRDATLAYLRSEFPTYTQFEQWILDQKGGSINQDEVEALNSAIRGYNHADETRSSILSAVGRADDGSVLDAVHLNALEDWNDFHADIK